MNISTNHAISFSLVQTEEYGPQTGTPELRREIGMSVQDNEEFVEDS